MRRASLNSSKASRPKTLTVPDSGRAKLTMLLIKVVFPAPFGPSNPKKRPALTSSETLSSAKSPFE
jgi:hypothetical protein